MDFLLAGPEQRAPLPAHGPRERSPVALHKLGRPGTKVLWLCHLGIAVRPSEGTEAQQETGVPAPECPEEQAPGDQDL